MRKAFILVAGTYGNAFLCTCSWEYTAKLNCISLFHSLPCSERINVKRLSSLKLPINILDAVWSVRFFTEVLNKLFCLCSSAKSSLYLYSWNSLGVFLLCTRHRSAEPHHYCTMMFMLIVVICSQCPSASNDVDLSALESKFYCKSVHLPNDIVKYIRLERSCTF